MQIATLIDYLLYAMFCVIVATALYKTWDVIALNLWLSRLGPEGIQDGVLDKISIAAESWLTLLVVLAQAAPFVGLTGTVLRIQEALTGLSGSSGIADIAHPVGAALHSTFLGLACAIPAVVAYGLLRRAVVRINLRAVAMYKERARAAREARSTHG